MEKVKSVIPALNIPYGANLPSKAIAVKIKAINN